MNFNTSQPCACLARAWPSKRAKMLRFLKEVCLSYRNNPYHNFKHVSSEPKLNQRHTHPPTQLVTQSISRSVVQSLSRCTDTLTHALTNSQAVDVLHCSYMYLRSSDVIDKVAAGLHTHIQCILPLSSLPLLNFCIYIPILFNF